MMQQIQSSSHRYLQPPFFFFAKTLIHNQEGWLIYTYENSFVGDGACDTQVKNSKGMICLVAKNEGSHI